MMTLKRIQQITEIDARIHSLAMLVRGTINEIYAEAEHAGVKIDVDELVQSLVFGEDE